MKNLFLENDPVLDHECTSWMVFNDLTDNNTNILHKNRDFKSRDIAVYLSPADTPRKWIAMGSGGGANMGMNISGLAGIMNSGEACINHSTDDSKKTTPQIMRAILSVCDTAAQAVEMLKKFIAEGDYWHRQKGSTFFFMDPNEGFVCELTAKDCLVQPYSSGYTVRANIWMNPGMQFYSRNSIDMYLDSAARMFIAYSGLNNALDRHGKITLEDIFDLSRHCKMPEESKEKRSLCFIRTNSTASLEVDRQYPDVLSTAYFTIGHPRNTVYVPVPIGVETILPAMGDESWSAAAFKRFDEAGFDAEIPPEWLKFEQDFMAKYRCAKDEARRLLDNGQRAEAVKLLNDTAYAIWQDAANLLGL